MLRVPSLNGFFSSQGHKILPISDSPLLLGHPTVDGNGWEVLLHQELGKGNATLHRLHKDHHLCESRGIWIHMSV